MSGEEASQISILGWTFRETKISVERRAVGVTGVTHSEMENANWDAGAHHRGREAEPVLAKPIAAPAEIIGTSFF